MAAPTTRMALTRAEAAGGWLLHPLDQAGSPSGPAEHLADGELAAGVARAERALSPRWVWRATSAAYPPLVAAGVRVARCHDLGHTERLLLAHEGRWSEIAAAQTSDGEPTLLDPLDGSPQDDATLLAEHAGQVRRIAAARADHGGFALLVAAESASALAAVEMGITGLPWDGATHDEILTTLLGPRPGPGQGRPAVLAALAEELATCLEDPQVNPDSPADLLRSLRRAGLAVTSTRRYELARQDHPAVPLVRRYKELARLWTANGWAWREAWVREGRFHPEYLPAGVVSGRWATRGGGALQIPKAVRGAVRAPAGRVLVVADAGQLEPRVLAAISRDPAMVAATRAGDLYAELAAQALGRPEARAEAKVALLSAMYGGGAGSPALAALRRRFGRALAVLEQAARAGEDGASVQSVLGRVCPPAEPGWLDGVSEAAAGAHARARGRFTRNFVVQASAADWAAVLIAGLRTRLAQVEPPDGPDGWQAQIVFFQHDEVMVEAAAEQAGAVIAAVADAGAEATRLVLGEAGVRIPLDAVVVTSYADKP
jgi:DNA polymerase-1